jgi:hypothetical protein
MAAAMLLLSLGGTFACLAYRFPLMTYFRHVGYVTSIAKVALLLAGGFGIDELLRALAAGPRWDRRTRFGALAALGIVLWILLDAQIGGRKLATLLVMAKGGSLVLEDWQEVLAAALRVLVYGGAAALVLWPGARGRRRIRVRLAGAPKGAAGGCTRGWPDLPVADRRTHAALR